MQEYVIAEGVLSGPDGSGGTHEVVYGFLVLPRASYRDGEPPQVSISAIAVKSLQGIRIPLGRYQLTSPGSGGVVLENTDLGWKIAPPLPASAAQTNKRSDAPDVTPIQHQANL